MKGIIGAIAGDIIGSTRENWPIKTKDFQLFERYSTVTDDTVLTLAIASWLLEDKSSRDILIENLKHFGFLYPNSGYGRSFSQWLVLDTKESYGSWSNGSAMRVSPCAWVADSLNEAHDLAYLSASVTHSHPEGIKGAVTTCEAIYLARIGSGKDEIKSHIEENYGYDLSRRLDDIRPTYGFEISCAKSVPESIICFLEAEDFEDAVRNAVSLGGDADTQAAIAGSIAAAYFEVPENISSYALRYLDEKLLDVFIDFEDAFM